MSHLYTKKAASNFIIFAQISAFFDNVFLKYQCGFRKGYNTQYCNLEMFEKWKNVTAKEKISVLY